MENISCESSVYESVDDEILFQDKSQYLTGKRSEAAIG